MGARCRGSSAIAPRIPVWCNIEINKIETGGDGKRVGSLDPPPAAGSGSREQGQHQAGCASRECCCGAEAGSLVGAASCGAWARSWSSSSRQRALGTSLISPSCTHQQQVVEGKYAVKPWTWERASCGLSVRAASFAVAYPCV